MTDTFDTTGHWDRMTDEQRRTIGVAAIDCIVALIGQDVTDPPEDAPFRRAAISAAHELEEAVIEACPAILEGEEMPLPSILARIRHCRRCGCTDDHACDGGCVWVEGDLCSRCAVAGDAP